jgi:hypothetical protein
MALDKSSLATKCVSVVLEVLDSTFMSLRGFLGSERAQVAAAAGFGILLARVKAVLAGF